MGRCSASAPGCSIWRCLGMIRWVIGRMEVYGGGSGLGPDRGRGWWRSAGWAAGTSLGWALAGALRRGRSRRVFCSNSSDRRATTCAGTRGAFSISTRMPPRLTSSEMSVLRRQTTVGAPLSVLVARPGRRAVAALGGRPPLRRRASRLRSHPGRARAGRGPHPADACPGGRAPPSTCAAGRAC